MGLFDLPRTDWICKNPSCGGEISSDEKPTCNRCDGEMKVNTH